MALTILGTARDLRTNTPVVYCQASIEDYLTLIGDDFGSFTIQRRRETHKPYKRLKDDIRLGALLPSITLSVKPEVVQSVIPLIEADHVDLSKFLSRPGQADILDGLQRTYIMSDLQSEGHIFPAEQRLLVEFWVEHDIQKLIYRIIVLNAGQKQMSIRHQIELLFMSLKTSVESSIDGLQIYTERDTSRRRRSRKFPLNFVVSAYQAFIIGSSELQKENLVAAKMQLDTTLDASEEEISAQYNSFIRYLDFYAKLDDQVFRVYSSAVDQALQDPIDPQEMSMAGKSSRNIHWLATENVMISFFAAVSQYTKSDSSENQERKLARLNGAFASILGRLGDAENGDDPLDLDVFDKLRQGTNPRRVNVGTATRRLLVNGFKEYFRDGGEIPLSEAWQLATE